MQSNLSFINRLVRVLAIFAATLTSGIGQAAYPEAPIKMIVAFAPGGGTDITARILAQYIQKHLGGTASVVVINRPGAGGGIGFGELSAAKPDGYTIGFINTPNVLTIPIERKVNFHWQDYDLLGNIVDDPGNFSVHADSPIKNLADLVAYAKANPGAVTYGTTGVGSDDHLAAMAFERAAGVTLTHVPFKGAGEVRGAIASKQIFLAALNIGEALQYQKGGTQIRNLGQMSEQRSNLDQSLPTFKEQGYNVVMASLRGVAAPKGLPTVIHDQLVRAVQAAASDPEFQAKALNMFAPLRFLAPAAYAAELKRDEQMFKQLWQTTPWSDK